MVLAQAGGRHNVCRCRKAPVRSPNHELKGLKGRHDLSCVGPPRLKCFHGNHFRGLTAPADFVSASGLKTKHSGLKAKRDYFSSLLRFGRVTLWRPNGLSRDIKFSLSPIHDF